MTRFPLILILPGLSLFMTACDNFSFSDSGDEPETVADAIVITGAGFAMGAAEQFVTDENNKALYGVPDHQ